MTTDRSTWFDVKQCGAQGNGIARDTRAIQKAIDACHRAGGGTVFFPPGNYCSGSLILQSHVTLYLEAGAVLWGSPREADYTAGPKMERATPDRKTGGCLLYGRDLEGVCLCGRGTIDGRGPAFWTRTLLNSVVWRPKSFRPRSLIYLVNCRDIQMDGITLHDSPCYTVWLLGCEQVWLRGLNIVNHRKGPNTDALDIDCCRNVRISDCHIDAGDDCIALKSDSGRLGRAMACENVTVTNCTLSSTACAIRVGYEGDAPIRNCTFSNLVMVDSHIGIDLISILPIPRPGTLIRAGTRIENIAFADIIMNRVERPIHIWMGNPCAGRFKGAIQNISISNVQAHEAGASYIGGAVERWAERIELRHVRLALRPGQPVPDPDELDIWGRVATPHGLHCRRVRGLQLNDVRVEWKGRGAEWRSPLLCRQVEDFEIRQFRAPAIKAPVIDLQSVKRGVITSCQAAHEKDICLRASSADLREVRRSDNEGN